eukprot:TRINITY_DN3942_c0_g1_i3.p1 TRINITY_DN3942_c0_g1~~TRINITY_DN3942_c0_g1_i3.p1  ORF type:complete len:465 (-),score=3.01 TRINITY_DN3942_c0_g1_i3:130-1524(-)
MPMELKPRPHALLLPLPAQGHVTPFAQLAQVLLDRNFTVTFINTDFVQEKLRINCDCRIRFLSFPDGLPPEHGRVTKLVELYNALDKNAPAHIERIITLLQQQKTPPTLMIADTVFSFAQRIADKFHIPRVSFRPCSAAGFLAFFNAPLLLDLGYLPLPEEKDLQEEALEKQIKGIPSLESLRVRDLPTVMKSTDASEILWQFNLRGLDSTEGAVIALLNTWDDLDAPVLSELNSNGSGRVTAIGPLLLMTPQSPLKSSLWTEESSCLQWLDTQKPGSVLFVSFGSITVLTQDELLEFAWGLEASNHPFLWVIRPDLLEGSSAIFPKEFVEKTRGRAHFASWVDQKRVLDHESVGGFLTHSGWNSVLESICAGVAMICWSFFAEQPTNRRFVSKVWNVGFEMDEIVERERVASVVKKLMDSASEEGMRVKRNAMKMKQSAVDAVLSGGSSRRNLQRFLDIVNVA